MRWCRRLGYLLPLLRGRQDSTSGASESYASHRRPNDSTIGGDKQRTSGRNDGRLRDLSPSASSPPPPRPAVLELSSSSIAVDGPLRSSWLLRAVYPRVHVSCSMNGCLSARLGRGSPVRFICLRRQPCRETRKQARLDWIPCLLSLGNATDDSLPGLLALEASSSSVHCTLVVLAASLCCLGCPCCPDHELTALFRILRILFSSYFFSALRSSPRRPPRLSRTFVLASTLVLVTASSASSTTTLSTPRTRSDSLCVDSLSCRCLSLRPGGAFLLWGWGLGQWAGLRYWCRDASCSVGREGNAVVAIAAHQYCGLLPLLPSTTWLCLESWALILPLLAQSRLSPV